MRKTLSPAAQAVLDAVITDNQTGPERFHARAYAAAALCAAADHIPDHQMSAHMLYAIATELENQ